MRYIFTFFISMCLITISGCDLFKTDENELKPEPIEIKSSIAYSVKATDVFQNEKGIFILGEAKPKGEVQLDFYLAQIDSEGNLLWEKMYGREYSEKAYAIISTKDAHLLLVGFSPSPTVNIDGDELFVIKVDYSGQIVWENTYAFKLDQGYAKFGGNTGRTVIEVSDGYIIGGEGMISHYQSGHEVPALTKVGFDGKEIWSKALSREYGYITGLAKLETDGRFAAFGYFFGVSMPILKTFNADTVKIINLESSKLDSYRFTDLLFSNGNLIALESGKEIMALVSVDQSGSNQHYYYFDQYPDIFTHSINKLANSSDVVTTGYVADKAGNRDVYAVRNTYNLSTVWRFTYDFPYANEEAVGAFALPENGVGIIANRDYYHSSSMILFKVDGKGNLK